MGNIGMVLQNTFPPDSRIEKEARAVLAAGHKVFLLAWNLRQEKEYEEIDGIVVRRVVLDEFLAEKINYVRWLFTLHDKFWEEETLKFVRDFNIELLHIHNLPLVGTVLRVAKSCRIPIVADLHEADYPATIAYHSQSGKDKIFLTPSRWRRKCEGDWFSEVDDILVVVEEAKDMLVKDWGIEKSKIHIVSNTEDVDCFQNVQLDFDLLAKYKDDFVVSYLGTFGPYRGLETAIEAITYLRDKIGNIKLLLVGASTHGERYNQELSVLVKSLKVEDKVEFCGWQPPHTFPTFITASKICLVPHYYTSYTNTTVPHKLFQYMLMGKPVLVSSCPPLARIVTETKCGLVFEAGDARDMADKIMDIYQDSGRYAQNGKKGVCEKYNWANDARELINVYSKLGLST